MLFARSAAECRLYIELNPCRCGATPLDVAHQVQTEADGSLSALYHYVCPGCGRPRAFVFTLDRQLPPPPPAFGAAAPSRIICPGQFALVSDRAARRGRVDNTGLNESEQDASLANLRYALAAVEEVLKFIPEGAEAVPPEAFTSDEGRRLYAAEPERFQRYRLAAVADTYRELIAAQV